MQALLLELLMAVPADSKTEIHKCVAWIGGDLEVSVSAQQWFLSVVYLAVGEQECGDIVCVLGVSLSYSL